MHPQIMLYETPLSIPRNNSLSVIPNPLEMVTRVLRFGTLFPRSIRLIAVRWSPTLYSETQGARTEPACSRKAIQTDSWSGHHRDTAYRPTGSERSRLELPMSCLLGEGSNRCGAKEGGGSLVRCKTRTLVKAGL